MLLLATDSFVSQKHDEHSSKFITVLRGHEAKNGVVFAAAGASSGAPSHAGGDRLARLRRLVRTGTRGSRRFSS